jgi:hypothetical protein
LSLKFLPFVLTCLAAAAMPAHASPAPHTPAVPLARPSSFESLGAKRMRMVTPRASSLPTGTFGVPTWLEQKVSASNGAAGDVFGNAGTVDGDTALISAPRGNLNACMCGTGGPGSVYVFDNVGGTWTQTQELMADDGTDNDQFGFFVALHGDLAVVGADFATVGTNEAQGAVYVFTRANGSWTQTQKLVADEPLAHDQFGYSVATDGTRIAVGAPGSTVNGNFQAGAVYVFENNGQSWVQAKKLVASDGVGVDGLGSSLAMNGTHVLAGAVNANGAQGAAYLFEESAGNWTERRKLIGSDSAPGDSFGFSLAYDGAHAVVGAPFATVGANLFQGALYVFNDSDGDLLEAQKLAADDGQSVDALGISASIDGDGIVGGGPFAAGSLGAAWVFRLSAATWTQETQFTASDAIAGQLEAFAFSVSISGDNVLSTQALSTVNDNTQAGAAYFYHRSPPDNIFADGFEAP